MVVKRELDQMLANKNDSQLLWFLRLIINGKAAKNKKRLQFVISTSTLVKQGIWKEGGVQKGTHDRLGQSATLGSRG